MMCLSFSEEFFTGNGEDYDLSSVPPSDRPTSVLQAIVSLERSEQLSIATDVLGCSPENAEFYVDSESFPFDVLDKVRATDCCDDCGVPVTVYIDPDCCYSLRIYE